MAGNSTTATAEKPLTKASVSGWAFTVEADTRRNGDIVLQSLDKQRLRGGIDASKPIIASPGQKSGNFEPTIPADQAAGLGALPKLPGMQISVNPDKLTYRISDPMYGNEELCKRFAIALRSKDRPVPGDKIVGVRPMEGKTDADTMKTLCRELRWLVEAGDAKVVSGEGSLPTMEEIDAMKGDYLQNPGAQTPWSQPRYEKDMESWRNQLNRMGD